MGKLSGAIVLVVMTVVAAVVSPATALMSPNAVASGVASRIPRGLYPGMIDLGSVVNDLVFSSDGALAYATTRAGISVIRTSDWAELSVLDVPGRPFGLTLIDGDTRLAVALNDSDSVVEIDLTTGDMVATHTLEEPWGIGSTAGGQLIVTSSAIFTQPSIVDRAADPVTVLRRSDLFAVTGDVYVEEDLASIYVAGPTLPNFARAIFRLDTTSAELPLTATSPALTTNFLSQSPLTAFRSGCTPAPARCSMPVT
jgi:hypothetical protein